MTKAQTDSSISTAFMSALGRTRIAGIFGIAVFCHAMVIERFGGETNKNANAGTGFDLTGQRIGWGVRLGRIDGQRIGRNLYDQDLETIPCAKPS